MIKCFSFLSFFQTKTIDSRFSWFSFCSDLLTSNASLSYTKCFRSYLLRQFFSVQVRLSLQKKVSVDVPISCCVVHLYIFWIVSFLVLPFYASFWLFEQIIIPFFQTTFVVRNGSNFTNDVVMCFWN